MSAQPSATAAFQRQRRRLQALAYRMLGSVAEAEDVVQDAWLRWQATDAAGVDNSEAWLVTTTTRLAIDRLRSAKLQREHYPGFWLPEPMLSDAPATPEAELERAGELSVAFLAVLERLAPEARAAFLLREVFDAEYAEIAQVLEKTEAACRQLVSRAKTQLREARPRYQVSAEVHRRLLGGLAQAMNRGDFGGLKALLAEGAELIGDGGGIVPSFGKPLVGAERIARLFYATYRRHGEAMRVDLVLLNGEWALLRWVEGRLESATVCETDGEQVTRLLVQRNPEKLARLSQNGGLGRLQGFTTT